jgi:hypothetical protein
MPHKQAARAIIEAGHKKPGLEKLDFGQAPLWWLKRFGGDQTSGKAHIVCLFQRAAV